MTRRLLLLAMFLSPLAAVAQNGSFTQWCQAGGQLVNVSGINSSTTVQASYPKCAITVFLTGTTTPATIFSTVGGTALANPFCANLDASFTFYAAQSAQYDVVMSNSNACNPVPLAQLPASFTFYDAAVSGTGGGGGGGGGTITGATPNGGLVVTSTTLGLTTSGCANGFYEAFNGTAWACALLGGTYGTDAFTAAGSDPCLQIQAAIYGLPAAGGIINATRFTSITTCSVNPFMAPAQSNPTVFTGLPAAGLLLLPEAAIPMDLPFFVPNKWRVSGVAGYGPAPGKSQIQPSTTFLANRPYISAVGTATTGLSSSGGLTVTITGTTLPSCTNLVGMFVYGSSNASATAVPDSTNAQIIGDIISCVGNVLTLSGPGASGTVANTGWAIVPVIAGWAPGPQNYAVMGAAIDWLNISAQTPAATYVNPSICWLDVTGQEESSFTNFNFTYCGGVGFAMFTSGAQNGGPFGPGTFNTKGQATASSIGVQLFGAGANAAGGGSSGLCGLANPCSGTGTREWHGITMLMDTAGVGTGFKVNAENVRFEGLSHCESLGRCWVLGEDGVALDITIDGGAGCSAVSCAITSVVDISANYANAGVPGPTQNLHLRNLQREFSTTWIFRDFINLVGDINDASVGDYILGGAGTANTQVWTSAQPLPCITSAGALDTNGAHCQASTQIPVISNMGARYFALGFNNNGAKDTCQQMSNAMQYANSVGLTEGVIIDATGFSNKFGNPCGISPWASGPGNYPYSGRLELSPTTFFLSLPWTVPANWQVTGAGGNGIGVGGGTGTNLSPNIGNTVNANYANDTVAGTVTCTAGSYTCTGAGTNFTSANLNHFFLACATLPCTTQSTMVGGLITTVGSTTSITLNTPAQSNLTAAAYTITAPLLVNNGVVRDLGVDSNGYNTGGFVAALQTGTAGSYIENFSAGHINAVGIAALGLNSGAMLRGPIQVNGSGNASSIFMCVDAPQGIAITESLTCQSNTTTNPTLSYGVLLGGQGINLTGLSFQNVAIGLELLVNSGYSTNGITISGVNGGPGASAVGTLIDIAGISSGGANANALAVNILGVNAGGATSTIVDHLQSYTLTDPELNYYLLGKQVGGCRTFQQDGHTTAVPQSISCGVAQFGSPVNVAGLPTCNSGSQFSFAAVLDSTSSPAWGATVVGGGTTPVTVQCNGSAWTIFAK